MKLSFNETFKHTKKFIYGIIAFLLLIYVLSGFYLVDQQSVGVHQRFGKIINPAVHPGLHYAFPYPFDKVDIVPVMIENRLNINDFYQKYLDGEPSFDFYRTTGLTSYCVTGDNNLVNISFVIQYTINDPVHYLFKMKENEEVLRHIAANSVIKAVSWMTIDDVLTIGQEGIGMFLQTDIQTRLEEIKAGLDVKRVELSPPSPPDFVKEYFDDVVKAKNDMERMRSDALSYRNEQIPLTEAEANRMMQAAETYKREVIDKAEGEASRFLNMLSSYGKSKKITRRRIYADFVKDVYPYIEKLHVIDLKSDKTPPAVLRFF